MTFNFSGYRRPVSRREFFKTLGHSACLFGAPLLAGSPFVKFAFSANLLKTFPTDDPRYLKNFLDRFHTWHRHTYFDVISPMSSLERKFIACAHAELSQWRLPVSGLGAVRTCYYAHRVRGEKVNSSGLFLLAVRSNGEAHKLAREICRHRKVPLSRMNDQGEPIGLRWDFIKGEFEACLLTQDLSRLQISPYRELYRSNFPKGGSRAGFRTWLIREGEKFQPSISEQRIWTAPQIIPKHTLLAKEGVESVFSAYSLKKSPEHRLEFDRINGGFLNAAGRRLVQQHLDEFSLELHEIEYQDPENFTLYYP